MEGRSHRAILYSVLKALGHRYRLPLDFVEGLRLGVVEPDKVLDRYSSGAPVRHHGGCNSTLINYYLDLALYLYRTGKYFEAGKALGRAIHYAQDGVLERHRYLVLDIHRDLEYEIARIVDEELATLIRTCIPQNISSEKLYLYRKLCKPSNRARDIVCRAIAVTYALLYEFLRDAVLDRESIEERYKNFKFALNAITVALALIGIGMCLARNLIGMLALASAIALKMVRFSIQVYAYRVGVDRPRCASHRTAM